MPDFRPRALRRNREAVQPSRHLPLAMNMTAIGRKPSQAANFRDVTRLCPVRRRRRPRTHVSPRSWPRAPPGRPRGSGRWQICLLSARHTPGKQVRSSTLFVKKGSCHDVRHLRSRGMHRQCERRGGWNRQGYPVRRRGLAYPLGGGRYRDLADRPQSVDPSFGDRTPRSPAAPATSDDGRRPGNNAVCPADKTANRGEPASRRELAAIATSREPNCTNSTVGIRHGARVILEGPRSRRFRRRHLSRQARPTRTTTCAASRW